MWASHGHLANATTPRKAPLVASPESWREVEAPSREFTCVLANSLRAPYLPNAEKARRACPRSMRLGGACLNECVRACCKDSYTESPSKRKRGGPEVGRGLCLQRSSPPGEEGVEHVSSSSESPRHRTILVQPFSGRATLGTSA